MRLSAPTLVAARPCSSWLEAAAVRDGGGNDSAATLGTCVAGELVAVDVELSNPLQVSAFP